MLYASIVQLLQSNATFFSSQQSGSSTKGKKKQVKYNKREKEKQP